jgi:hypothetical protein
MRRLRVRPSQPSLRGPRETLLGPTTRVRPATGWWERMNAGESPRNQGRSVKAAPVRFQKAVSRSKEKRRGEAPIGAPVRVMGRLFPSAEGTGFAARRPTGAAFRISACRRFAPSDGGGHSPKGGRAPVHPKRWRTPTAWQPRHACCALPSTVQQRRNGGRHLAKRTRGTSDLRFGGTNPSSLFPFWAIMIVADQPSGTTRGF